MQKTPVEAIRENEHSSPKLMRHADHLKSGSPVLVRIIGAKGNGRYEASVAGTRIFLSSAKNLKAGDTFKGIIGLKNGFITITPAEGAETLGSASIKETFSLGEILPGNLFDPVSSPALASLLASLNLPSDNFSFNMLLQFKQLGMKLDPKIMRKIRREAEKAPNPKEKMEELVMKAQKRLESVQVSDQAFLQEKTDSSEEEKRAFSSGNSLFSEDWLSEIKNFISEVTGGNLENRPGELTLMNHTGFFKDKTSEYSWIQIPFEITNPFEEKTEGNGKIMIMLGSSDKSFRQMNLHINYKEGAWRFLVSKDAKKILFSSSNEENLTEQARKLEEHFLSAGKIVRVETIPFEKLEGSGWALEDFKTAEGNA